MNKCINLKQKFNKTLYCKKLNKEINIRECNNCQFKEFKSTGFQYKSPVKTGISQRTKKLAKAEKNRFSILTNDLTYCYICKKNDLLVKRDALHEVFFGSNRLISIKYGLVIPLCVEHHREMHKNHDWQEYWHIVGQKAFMNYYNKSVDEFIEVFGKNYLSHKKRS